MDVNRDAVRAWRGKLRQKRARLSCILSLRRDVKNGNADTLAELAAQGVDILTLGQYLQPTREHLPVVRFVHPDEFAEYKMLGERMGLRHVESGPLVRSSYHAFEQERSVTA